LNRPILWLTGPPGSGKTTAGRSAAARLKLGYRSAGEIFRKEAEERSMSLADFSRFAETHPEVDRTLDDGLMAEARPGVVLEGRVVGALLRRRGSSVFGVLVTASEEVRAQRLAGRDGTDLATALTRMRQRSQSERQRYWDAYKIRLEEEPMDGVVDTSTLPKEAAAARLVELFEGAGAHP
jgi:cytidylate kinase